MTARRATIRDLLDAVQRGDVWWGVLAACVDEDPVLFFPEPGQHPTVAKQVCAACPVRSQCEQFALTARASRQDDDSGVFGGTTEWERRQLRARTTRRAPLVTDREQVVAAFELTTSVGINEAAARLGLSPRWLREAFDRWQLGRPPSSQPAPSTPVHDHREEAVRAFALAEQVGLREAARQLGTGPGALYRAFDRWQLGRPDTSRSAARWDRQIRSGANRQRAFRDLERLRRASRASPATAVSATAGAA